MYKNKIWFFDNIINLDLQEKIKNLFLSNNFPWYFIPDVTNQKNQQQRPALQHYFVDEKNFTSQHIDLIKPIIDNSCNKIIQTYRKSKIFFTVFSKSKRLLCRFSSYR